MADQNYLTSNPYNGQHGATADAAGWAWKGFNETYGRNPSSDELAQAIPVYQGSDPHISDVGGGNAYLAQLHQSNQNTPANYYADQQKKWNQAAPEHYDQVSQVFKGLYGRDPTQDELSHYGTLLASGQADQYQVGQFLQSLPEYQNAQDKTFRSGLNDELQGYDQKEFARSKEDVISRYAQMGRSTSPALDVALTDLQAQINERRGNFLAKLSASQYGGNKDAAMSAYKTTQGDVTGRINQDPYAEYNNYNESLKRSQEISDYNRQSLDYGRNMDRYGPGRSPTALDYINTAAGVAGGAGKGAQGYAAVAAL